MNATWIRKLLGLIGMMVLVMGAQAQDLLPLPRTGEVTLALYPLTYLRPDRGAAWNAVGAPKYTVKASALASGVTGKWTVKAVDNCTADHCEVLFFADQQKMNAFFGSVTTGELVRIRVIAKYGDGLTVKSAPMDVPVLEVAPAMLLSPANGAMLGGPVLLTWADLALPLLEKAIVVDTATGGKVFAAEGSCAAHVCSVDPFASGVLVEGRTYKWFVVSENMLTGEKTKSLKHIFTIGGGL